MEDLFTLYMNLRKGSEPPAIFHRWAWMGCLGAKLGRRIFFPFGEQRIYPNHYIMFIGDPGSRKSVSIRGACGILSDSGYSTFSANRSSKEKFLMDLAGMSDDPSITVKGHSKADVLDALALIDLSSVGSNQSPRECFINADEFNNFMGNGNIEFQSILGELWDWDNEKKPWDLKLKNSESIKIWQPTVSILAGNTPTNFGLCFPLATIGQGFMSRLLLIHGEETNIKHTIPPTPDPIIKERIQRGLAKMSLLSGPMQITKDGYHAIDRIYNSWPALDDGRFRHYSTRRFTHLIKVCMTVAASRYSMTISQEDVIHANTVLAYAETQMPKAMGELGKAKYAEAADKIMQHLYRAKLPVSNKELFKVVSNDVEKITDLGLILTMLQESDKIIMIKNTSKEGWMAKIKPISRKLQFIDEKWIRGKELPND